MTFDPDAFIKKYGRDAPIPTPSAPRAPATAAPPTAEAPAEPAAPQQSFLERATHHPPAGQVPTDDDMDWQQQGGKGVAKGLANVAIQADKLGRYIAPNLTESAHTLARQIPGAHEAAGRVREFAAEPTTSTPEMLGEAGGEIAPTMFAPVGAGEALAGGLAKAVLPKARMRTVTRAMPVFGPGGWTLQNVVTQVPNMARARALAKTVRAARKVGSLGEAAGEGAIGGALSNPDDPGSGAIAGAMGAPVGRAAGGMLRGKLARFLGQVGLPEAVYYGAHKMIPGLPYYPFGAAITWHFSPLGKRLKRIGNQLVDETGRLIGSIHPAAMGYGAGAAARELAPEGMQNVIGEGIQSLQGDGND